MDVRRLKYGSMPDCFVPNIVLSQDLIGNGLVTL